MSDYKFTRATDAQIVGLFDRLKSLENGANGFFNVVGDLSLPIGKKAESAIDARSLIGPTTFSISSAWLNFENKGSSGGVRYDRDGIAPFIDRIHFTSQFSGFSEEFRFLIISEIIRFLDMAPPVALAGQGQNALDQTKVILNQVSSAALALTEHSAEREKSLDAARDADRARADAELADEKDRLHALHEEDRQNLNRMRVELAQKAAELDNRENTHVRRQIHKTMSGLSGVIASEGLLQKSAKESYLVTGVSLLFGLILAVGAWFTAGSFEGLKDQSVIIFLEVTRVLLGLGAGALIWFGISNLAARNRRVAQWEQELNRFRLDVERASFLIEGDLEARKFNHTGLPEVMLEAFSRGLFANDKADHGSDQVGNVLAHLFSNSAKFKVGSDGVEAELNGKGIKKAQKEVD